MKTALASDRCRAVYFEQAIISLWGIPMDSDNPLEYYLSVSFIKYNRFATVSQKSMEALPSACFKHDRAFSYSRLTIILRSVSFNFIPILFRPVQHSYKME